MEAAQSQARGILKPIPAKLPSDTPLFNVPKGFIKIFDRDLIAAGIDKTDERGKTVDIHCLRHSFATHLSKAGVAPRIAQAAMRHSSIDLTMNAYTDPKLLNVAGALDMLPALPLNDSSNTEYQKATGTNAVDSLAPNLAPTTDKSSKFQSNPDKIAGGDSHYRALDKKPQTIEYKRDKHLLTTTDKGRKKAGERIRTADVQLGKLAFYH